MHRLSIIDDFCPRPYDDRSPRCEPMGGTESAIVLLCEALAANAEVSIEVLQHNRVDEHVSESGVRYRGSLRWRRTAQSTQADTIVIINSPKLLSVFDRHAPTSRLVLWRHNFLGNRHRSLNTLLDTVDATLVCVSRYHHRHTLTHLSRDNPALDRSRIRWIHNPVQIYPPPNCVLDPDKLLFCSSPHKGFEVVLSRFRSLRRLRPRLKLHVCNPGYMADSDCRDAGVVVIGALDRPALHRQMASSLCLFTPQTQFRETFGLVAAEANALHTPVLGPASFGALPEIVHPSNPLLCALDSLSLTRMIDQWQQGHRPLVRGNPEFDARAVCHRWMQLLGLSEKADETRPRRHSPSSRSRVPVRERGMA